MLMELISVEPIFLLVCLLIMYCMQKEVIVTLTEVATTSAETPVMKSWFFFSLKAELEKTCVAN
jgi:hypothetical protein